MLVCSWVWLGGAQSSSMADLEGGLVTPAQQREPQRSGALRSRPPPLDTTQQGLAAAPHMLAGSGPLGTLLAQLGSSSLQHPATAGQVRHSAPSSSQLRSMAFYLSMADAPRTLSKR